MKDDELPYLKSIDAHNIILFMSHLSVADGIIHDGELDLVDKFLFDAHALEQTRVEVKKILCDTDDKVKREAVFTNLKESGDDSLNLAARIGLSVAHADGFLDIYEDQFFKEFIECTGFDTQQFDALRLSVLRNAHLSGSQIEDCKEGLLELLYKRMLLFLKEYTRGNIKRSAERGYKRFLLVGRGYAEAIDLSAKIASADFEISKKEIDGLIDKHEFCIEGLDNMIDLNSRYKVSENEYEKHYYDTLTKLHFDLTNVLLKGIEEIKGTLIKKQRALKYYTIAFIGKTKSGKSTLHSVITGRGEEFIGRGQQRTTRFNRVYEWNRIRIIDTPGIGAPGGKTDEEIARSVLDESDIICYVLKNDSVQESEFEFLKLIKNQNKPIVVLLNIKENLENETKLKYYLRDPNKWYKRTDEMSISGHIERIRRYAKEHYKNGYFEIFPVQLLAAKMSFAKEFHRFKEVLFDSSRIQEFLDSLRLQIIDEGIIRRTQTMIDGTIHVFNKSQESLHTHITVLSQLREKLSQSKLKISKDIKGSYDVNSKSLKSKLENAFSDLIEKSAMEFAMKNYASEKEDISDLWNSYLLEIRFEEELKSIMDETCSIILEDVKRSIKDLEEDIALISKCSFQELDFDLRSTFDAKSLMNVLGGIGALAGSILLAITPIGWVIIGLSAIIGIISSLMKSKKERIQEATDRLYESLKKGIEKSEEEIVSDSLRKIREFHDSLQSSVKKQLEVIIGSIEETLEILNPLHSQLNFSINHLNKVLAKRILNFAKNSNEVEIDFVDVNQSIVRRDFGKQIEIYCNESFEPNVELTLSKILQERIFFKQQF